MSAPLSASGHREVKSSENSVAKKSKKSKKKTALLQAAFRGAGVK